MSSSSYILRVVLTRVSIDMAVFWGVGVAVVSIDVEVSIDLTVDARNGVFAVVGALDLFCMSLK